MDLKRTFNNFFNNSKAVFVLITALLWLGGLGLVFSKSIDFSTYVSSLTTVSVAVTALYQWYNKREVTDENEILKSENEILKIKNKTLQTSNTKLRKLNKNGK